MLLTASVLALVSARVSNTKSRSLFFSHMRLGDCDCSWTGTPGACNTPDGSTCWNTCCKSGGGGGGGGGGGCDCSWSGTPGACSHDDGSKCWQVCCGNNPPSGPTPSPEPSPPPSPLGDWQPVELVQEYYEHELQVASRNLTRALTNGFSRQGSMRYHSAKKLNLLGGGLKFTVNLAQVKNLVNANLYLVIPGTLDGGSHFYCDNSAGFVGKGNACIELDIMESNGNQLAASTMHTKIGTSGHDCDTWGCRGVVYFNGNPINGGSPFDVEVDVSNDGDIKVYYKQGGRTATAFSTPGGWDGAAKAAVVDGMRNHGAVVVSSMWTGWVPPNTSGNGDLNGSHYTLSNLIMRGSFKGNTH